MVKNAVGRKVGNPNSYLIHVILSQNATQSYQYSSDIYTYQFTKHEAEVMNNVQDFRYSRISYG